MILLLMVWADDFTLVSGHISELQIMLSEFAEVLSRHGIWLKESKSQWMANRVAWQKLGDDSFQMEVPQVPGHQAILSFERVEQMIVLGSCLNVVADSAVAVDFAIERARRHWLQRRTQLCRRRVPLSRRIAAFYDTVGRTLLHGLEGVVLKQSVAKTVQSFDRQCLREMLCMKKRDDEAWLTFRRRQHAVIRQVFSKLGRMGWSCESPRSRTRCCRMV